MFTGVPLRHSFDFNGKTITLETGLLANQATSSVLASIGNTTILAAVTVGKVTQGDYFPLQVIYEERYYAAGKIKSSQWNKREGRANDNAVLTGRMIDRSLRSLFNPNIRTEVQVVITVLSLDEINQPDTLSVLAASSALCLCGFETKVAEEFETDRIIEFGQKVEGEVGRMGIAGIIFNPFLQKYGVIKSTDKSYFQWTAGGQDEGETEEMSLRREILEESGITEINDIYKLGNRILAHFYHDSKQVYRIANGQPYLVITEQQQPGQTSQEVHEDYTFSWQDSITVLNLLQTEAPEDVKAFLIEQFTRGVSKAIQLGLDVVSDPSIFNKQFSDSIPAASVFNGPVSSVRIGLKRSNIGELKLEQIRPVLENISSMQELQAMSDSLTSIAQVLDYNDEKDKVYLNEISRLLGKKSPQYAIFFKEIIQNTIPLPKSTVNNTFSSNEFLINPTYIEDFESELDLVVSGNGDNIVMLECGAKIVPENVIAKAIEAAIKPLHELTKFQQEFITLAKNLPITEKNV